MFSKEIYINRRNQLKKLVGGGIILLGWIHQAWQQLLTLIIIPNSFLGKNLAWMI